MPDETPNTQPQATATVVNNGLGWLAPVANMTVVGAMLVFLFWSHNTATQQMNRFEDNANKFHDNIYQAMGQQAALQQGRDAQLTDVQHRLDSADRKLDWIEWRLSVQSGSLSSLFTPEPKKK